MKRISYLSLGIIVALVFTTGVASALPIGLKVKTVSEGVATAKFTAEQYPSEINASYGTVRFSTPESKVECTGNKGLSEPVSGPSNVTFVTSGFSNCTIGEVTATVSNNNCFHWYRVRTDPETGLHVGDGGLGCPPGSSGVLLTAKFAGFPLCTILLRPQTAGELLYWNSNGIVAVGNSKSEPFEYQVGGAYPLSCGRKAGTLTDGTYYMQAGLTA